MKGKEKNDTRYAQAVERRKKRDMQLSRNMDFMTRLAIAHAWEPDEVCDRAIFVCHTCGVYNKNMDAEYMGTNVFIPHKSCRKRHCCMIGCDIDHFIMKSFMTLYQHQYHQDISQSEGR